MNTTNIMRRGAVAAMAAILLGSSPASAYHLSAASADCRASVAKSYGKLLKAATKTIAGCHKARNKDASLAGTDCNDMAQADAAKGKYASTVTKTIPKFTDACLGEATEILTAANVGGEVGESELWVSCPVSPCTGVSSDNLIDEADEIGACLGCVAASIAEDAGAATLGLPDPALLDKDEQKCHAAIAKGYAKYLSTAHKTETSCQSTADETGEATLVCSGDDPKLKVSKSLTKAGEGLDKKCAIPSLADLDSCSDVDLASLKSCNAAEWGVAKDDAYTTTYELPATGCPSAVRTTIFGGCSAAGGTDPGNCDVGNQTGTVLSVGWKGLAHGVDITDNYTIAVDVTCTGTEKGSCGTCTSSGISSDNPQYADFLRCVDAPWTTCTLPFQNDPSCPSNGLCKYFLGPPLAISAGGSPTCTLNVVNSDIAGGTGDPDAGTADFLVDLRSVVHLGVSLTRPCPYCLNDPVPQDGDRSGTCTGGTNAGGACSSDTECTGGGNCTGNFGSCLGGPRDGQPCDVQAFDLTFANPTRVSNPSSGNSLDCPPSSGANISGSGLVVSLPLTTGTSIKDAEDPCDAPNGALDCFCGVCSGGGGGVPCNSDTECANLGFGTCEFGAGTPRLPNACDDGVCWPQIPARTDRGQCSADSPLCEGGTEPGSTCAVNADCDGGGTCVTESPNIETFCSGMVFANGKGVIACGTDGDCDASVTGNPDPTAWVCPNDDCGTCTVNSFVSCFLDPIEITGTPDPANPILVGTFCLPPSSNTAVNETTGSPGPGVVQTDAAVTLRY